METGEGVRQLLARFDTPPVKAVLLVGSYARGDAGPYSDVDLFRLTSAPLPDAGTHLWEGKLVNVSDAVPEAVEARFGEPERAIDTVTGLREARVLRDREERADRRASAQLAGWAEEAHKGLAGLWTGDTGRLLNAQFSLSWGLAKTVRVQYGLLSGSDNAFFADLQPVFAGTRWLELLQEAYGLTGLALPEQVRAGLELYAHTAGLLEPALHDGDRPVVEHMVQRIRRAE